MTADSVLDVVVEVAGSFTTVVQDEKTSAQAGSRRRLRDSFFIVVGVYADTPDSTPNGLADGFRREFFPPDGSALRAEAARDVDRLEEISHLELERIGFVTAE